MILMLLSLLFNEIGAEKSWVTFGKGKKIRYISIHDVCNAMSPEKNICSTWFSCPDRVGVWMGTFLDSPSSKHFKSWAHKKLFRKMLLL